jgi:hypothetical protein
MAHLQAEAGAGATGPGDSNTWVAGEEQTKGAAVAASSSRRFGHGGIGSNSTSRRARLIKCQSHDFSLMMLAAMVFGCPEPRWAECGFRDWSLNFPFSNNNLTLYCKKKLYKNTLHFDFTYNNEGKMSNCNIYYGKTKITICCFKELKVVNCY